jgi:glycosyltransferase involved in cell wall biosynthesis
VEHPVPRTTQPTVSVVVPALNEAENLAIVLPQLPRDAEILVVDGHSTDDTHEVVRRVRPDARLLDQTRRGKGNALVCGFEAARGDTIVMFDADGSADPAEIPRFVRALAAGADVAKGTRFAGTATAGSEDITWLRRAGNAGLRRVANTLLRSDYTDLCYGYNAFWRDLLPTLGLPAARLPEDTMVWGDGFEIEALLTCRFAQAGLRIAEVSSTEKSRIHGESNLRTFSDGVRVLRTLGREYTRPLTPRRTAPVGARRSVSERVA